MDNEKVRVDKWLWAVRVFKTRQLASEACKRGRVSLDGQKLRPSRMVCEGDKIVVVKDGLEWEYQVAGCIQKRVGAKAVSAHRKDLTPEDKIQEMKSIKSFNAGVFKRPRGAGRPTKKERRELDGFRKGRVKPSGGS